MHVYCICICTKEKRRWENLASVDEGRVDESFFYFSLSSSSEKRDALGLNAIKTMGLDPRVPMCACVCVLCPAWQKDKNTFI